jgi:hypothetical protein
MRTMNNIGLETKLNGKLSNIQLDNSIVKCIEYPTTTIILKIHNKPWHSKRGT